MKEVNYGICDEKIDTIDTAFLDLFLLPCIFLQNNW